MEKIKKKNVWDKEYATQFKEEMLYLKNCGIPYDWVIQNENGLSVWKYKKTAELFAALTNFYEQVYYR